MASDDVIELGSSDEETEPTPKKRKPMPNAMVSIPSKLHDVTIKPSRSNQNLIQAKKLIGKAVTVTRVMKGKPLIVNKVKANGKPVAKINTKLSLNPFANNQKVPIIRPPILITNKQGFTRLAPKTANEISLKKPVCIKNLPPSIAIKKTVSRPLVFIKPVQKKPVGEVLTVELDDDDVPAQSSPQWYLRPEEQVDNSTKEIEKKNNEEPETSNFIEITIEESPVKSISDKRKQGIGSELAIVIDDSPIKAAIDKSVPDSDGENDKRVSNKVPNSKKKLDYPKESKNVIEIEIGGIEVSNVSKEDPLSITGQDEKHTEKVLQDDSKPITIKNKTESIKSQSSSEFHPIYQSFIDLCFELENSDDMKKIVEKKIKGYYRQVPKEYTESEEFIDMVSSKILSMKAGPEKMFLYIKDIVDELNLQRKQAKALPVAVIEDKEPSPIYDEENGYSTKRQRQIRKLEKTIKKLHRAIQKLEEQEIDFDDEDDSVYLLTERYKERMVRVYAKFCQLSNTKMPSEPRIQIDARPGQPTGPAKRLEKWINKKVPIGTPLPFPDFHDVLNCVRTANNEDNLGFNEVDIMEEARDLFTRCGRKLQRRRQENEWRLAASRIVPDNNSLENDMELQRKLNENRKIAAQKETEIFNKFADKQKQLKLEGEEIGDKEADESPVESEDEENADDMSLENKDKRKERLKRLLQDKSKKTSEEKENQQTNEDKKLDDMVTIETKTEIIDNENTAVKETAEEKDKAEKDKIDKDSSEMITETLTLSDDSNELESDIDELHLLQKLHSGNEQSSTADSSDSEMSDSLELIEHNKAQRDDDVISIEDSSYSEDEDDRDENSQISNTDSVHIINDDSMPSETSEMNNVANEPTDATEIINDDNTTNETTEIVETSKLNNNTEIINDDDLLKETITNNMNVLINTTEIINDDSVPSETGEILNDVDMINKTSENTNKENVMDINSILTDTVQSNNDQYTETVEDILLASSDDEDNSQGESMKSVCVNLRDDLISIDETVVGHGNNESHKEENKLKGIGQHLEVSSVEINSNKHSEVSFKSNSNSQCDDLGESVANILNEIISSEPNVHSSS